MKKFYFLFLFALIASVSNIWAAEKTVTFVVGTDSGSTMKKNEITIVAAQSSGSNPPAFDRTDQYRIYTKNTVTISSDYNITKIEFTCTANNKSQNGPGNLSAASGYSYSGKIGTWTGSAKSVVFTATAQCRATKIEVTYEAPEETKCATPTFNLTNGETYTDAQTLNIETTTADATIHYTINGGEEKTGQPEEFTENGTYTVNAWATKDGLTDSEHASIEFSIEKKCATPTFSPAAGYVKLGDAITFSSTTADAVISYKYSYNEEEYSEFAEGTSFTPDKNGTYKIIAKASKTGYGDGVSEEQTYTVANAVFYETFDKCDGTGGNDGQWKGGIAANKFSDDVCDNAGWTGPSAYAANGCARFGTGSKAGNATTPELTNLNGDAILSFRAGDWDGDGNTLTVSISKGEILGNASFKLENAAFKDYSVSIAGADGTSKITFSVDNKRFFLDDVKVIQAAVNSPVATLGFKAAEIEKMPWIAEKETVLTGETEEDVNASCLKLTCEDGAQIEYTLSTETVTDTTPKTIESGTEITLEEGVLYELTAYAVKDGEKSFSRDYMFSIGSTSSVSSVPAEGVKVMATEGGIEVVADEAADVAVYTAAGQLVRATRVAEGKSLVSVAPGFYVVRANGAATKVVVR